MSNTDQVYLFFSFANDHNWGGKGTKEINTGKVMQPFNFWGRKAADHLGKVTTPSHVKCDAMPDNSASYEFVGSVPLHVFRQKYPNLAVY